MAVEPIHPTSVDGMKSFCGRLSLVRRFKPLSHQSEAADGVFADAAEVEFAVTFNDVGDLGVAVGGAVLEVLTDTPLPVKSDNK